MEHNRLLPEFKQVITVAKYKPEFHNMTARKLPVKNDGKM
jgi:hypothetical protein